MHQTKPKANTVAMGGMPVTTVDPLSADLEESRIAAENVRMAAEAQAAAAILSSAVQSDRPEIVKAVWAEVDRRQQAMSDLAELHNAPPPERVRVIRSVTRDVAAGLL